MALGCGAALPTGPAPQPPPLALPGLSIPGAVPQVEMTRSRPEVSVLALAPKLLPKEVSPTPLHAMKTSAEEKGLCPTQDGTPEC